MRSTLAVIPSIFSCNSIREVINVCVSTEGRLLVQDVQEDVLDRKVFDENLRYKLAKEAHRVVRHEFAASETNDVSKNVSRWKVSTGQASRSFTYCSAKSPTASNDLSSPRRARCISSMHEQPCQTRPRQATDL